MEKNVEIFCSYAHQDQVFVHKLRTHLAPLLRFYPMSVWHDIDISPGSEWESEVQHRLNTAHIILLLVSPDFMASDYCYSREMVQAMKRHEQGKACVIPIILRPVYWDKAPFHKLQALPPGAKPITDPVWHSEDEAFLAVVVGIRHAVEKLSAASFSQPTLSPSRTTKGVADGHEENLTRRHNKKRQSNRPATDTSRNQAHLIPPSGGYVRPSTRVTPAQSFVLPSSRLKAHKIYLTIISILVLLLIGVSSWALYNILENSHTTLDRVLITGANRTQTVANSTTLPGERTTVIPTPTLTPTTLATAADGTIQKGTVLSCGGCDDPLRITINTITIDNANGRMIWNVTLNNNSGKLIGFVFDTFSLQSATFNSTPIQGSGSLINNYDYVQAGNKKSYNLVFSFVPFKNIHYTLTVEFRSYDVSGGSITFDPLVVNF